MSDLNSSAVDQLLRQALDAATSAGQRVSVAIVDAGGHLMAFRRMDRVPHGAVDMAQTKARTAVMFGIATGQLPGLSPIAVAFAAANAQPVAMLPGGMPILNGDRIIGGIGIGGASDPAIDHDIAQGALVGIV